jgi:hypothetical protein
LLNCTYHTRYFQVVNEPFNFNPAERTSSHYHSKDLTNTMAGQNSALLLSRAGEILQEIFYLYKEKIFLKKVTSIEVKGDKIYIEVENVDNTTQITKLPTFAELLQACPSKNKCGSNGVKKAVATYDASSDAVAWMHDMVKYMLDGKLDLIPGSLMSLMKMVSNI